MRTTAIQAAARDGQIYLQVELKVRSIRCVSRADNLPFELVDAMRSEEELQREDTQFATVTQDTRLENRWIDLRTPVNQAIFQIQSAVCQVDAPKESNICWRGLFLQAWESFKSSTTSQTLTIVGRGK